MFDLISCMRQESVLLVDSRASDPGFEQEKRYTSLPSDRLTTSIQNDQRRVSNAQNATYNIIE